MSGAFHDQNAFYGMNSTSVDYSRVGYLQFDYILTFGLGHCSVEVKAAPTLKPDSKTGVVFELYVREQSKGQF